MKHNLNPFFIFLINNYYTPLTHDEFVNIIEEYFDSNPEIAEEFGNIVGETLADDIFTQLGETEECYLYLEMLQDFFPHIYEYAISRAHYEYMVMYFVDSIATNMEADKT